MDGLVPAIIFYSDCVYNDDSMGVDDPHRGTVIWWVKAGVSVTRSVVQILGDGWEWVSVDTHCDTINDEWRERGGSTRAVMQSIN